jgi:Na+/melibiose symporter-like transporter
MVCAILAMVILIFYKLDKLYPTIQKELAERREKKIME